MAKEQNISKMAKMTKKKIGLDSEIEFKDVMTPKMFVKCVILVCMVVLFVFVGYLLAYESANKKAILHANEEIQKFCFGSSSSFDERN